MMTTPASLTEQGIVTAPGAATTVQSFEGNKAFAGSESTTDQTPALDVDLQAATALANLDTAVALRVGAASTAGSAPFCDFSRARQLRCQMLNSSAFPSEEFGGQELGAIDEDNNYGRGLHLMYGSDQPTTPSVLRLKNSESFGSLQSLVIDNANLVVGGYCDGGADDGEECVEDSTCTSGICDPAIAGARPNVYGIHMYQGWNDRNKENYWYQTAFSANQFFYGQGKAEGTSAYTGGFVSRGYFGTHKEDLISPRDFRYLADVVLKSDGSCAGGASVGLRCEIDADCPSSTCTHTDATITAIADFGSAPGTVDGCTGGKIGETCTTVEARYTLYQQDGFALTTELPYFLYGEDPDSNNYIAGPLVLGGVPALVPVDPTAPDWLYVLKGINVWTQGISFNAGDDDGRATCDAAEFYLYADNSEGKFKKCENGVRSDLDTSISVITLSKEWVITHDSSIPDTYDLPSIFANRTPKTWSLREVCCEVDSGTVTIQLQKDDGSPASILSATGAGGAATDLTCNTAMASGCTSTFVSGESSIQSSRQVDFLLQSNTGGTPAKRISVYVEYDFIP
jgi:hypothetical protein